MRVSIIGTGYVGLVSGTCFAEIGHDVTCIDIMEDKIKMLKGGEVPIYEPGLKELIERNVSDKRLEFSTSFDSVIEADAIFIAVGTPSAADGSADLKYIYGALDSVIPNLKDESIVVIKSTVPVGTNAKIKEYLKENCSKKVAVVNNPEFLKEGTAVDDFLKPDRIVVGFTDEAAGKKIVELYKPFSIRNYNIFEMSNLSAEMTKYAANCFLATKISFINEIARLCDKTGADVNEVRSGISSDPRIGHHFLYPGPGYGGSCFPKDVKALIKTAKDHDIELEIVNAAEKVNEEQKSYIVSKMKKYFKNDLKGKKIALWGVAFKANTDDVRETAAISITKELSDAGAEVYFYDPVASTNFLKAIEPMGLKATQCSNKYEALDQADALVTVTEWKNFLNPNFDLIKEKMNTHAIFDARNLYDTELIKSSGFDYFAIGKKID
jgi:UDPglucose 6-dehydrogenase